MSRNATACCCPGATLLLMAWTPGRRGPLPRGASREDIQTAFPEWTLIDDEAMDDARGRAWICEEGRAAVLPVAARVTCSVASASSNKDRLRISSMLP